MNEEKLDVLFYKKGCSIIKNLGGKKKLKFSEWCWSVDDNGYNKWIFKCEIEWDLEAQQKVNLLEKFNYINSHHSLSVYNFNTKIAACGDRVISLTLFIELQLREGKLF